MTIRDLLEDLEELEKHNGKKIDITENVDVRELAEKLSEIISKERREKVSY